MRALILACLFATLPNYDVVANAAEHLLPLSAGDADMDYIFDQHDLIQVLQAGRYLTGLPATWKEGDWDGAPGGSPGNPPKGDGLFNQTDVLAAFHNRDGYQARGYSALARRGVRGDEQTSIIYDTRTGEIAVDVPASTDLTSINIDSAAGIFTNNPGPCVGDCDSDNNIFKATFGSSFRDFSWGNAAQVGLAEDFVLTDLTVVGSLAGGGDLGNVDLIYVPEPSTLVLFSMGAFTITFGWWRRGRVA